MKSKTLALLAAVALAACARAPEPTASLTQVRTEAAAAAPRFDPEKKTVVVLVPPSAPQLAAQQEARIAAEQEQTETRIHSLMERYTDNLGNAKQKAQLGEEISQELAAYKRHTLALYKLQQE